MMIDEAITRERQIAKEQRSHIGTWYSKIMGYDDEYIKKCEVCAKEHEQLAEWLEELKELRANSCGYSMEDIELNRNAAYNKAIDDIVKFANTMPTVEEEDGTIRPMWLEEIAEKLKVEAEYNNGWIPCSERLPNDLIDVLVWFEYYRFGNYNGLYQTIGISYTNNGEWSRLVNGTSGWKELRIIAWQPLPQPPKGE